jgi:hypothetical protein
MTSFPLRTSLATWAFLALTACNNPGGADERRSVSSAEALARVERNPTPVQGHRILVSVEGAPGPLNHAEAMAHYQGVDSYGCRYPTTGLGTFSVPRPRVPVPVTRLPDGRFELTVYEDAFLSTDLFGTGVCEWSMLGPTIALRVTDPDAAMHFVAHVPTRHLRERLPTTLYFASFDYLHPRDPGVGLSGIMDRERFSAEVQDQLFTVTLLFVEGSP